MMDNQPPQSIGESIIEPTVLSDDQEDLCRRLDDLHARNGLNNTNPSRMFKGAVFVSRTQLRSNPDWVAQAANSLRGILYPFGKQNIPNQVEALRQYGAVHANEQDFTREVGRVFGSLTELAHHSNGSRGNTVNYSTYTSTDFENLLADFERVMSQALLRQIDIHHEIDGMFEANETPNVVVANSADIKI